MESGARLVYSFYAPERREEWDRFVARSKNGTFLFQRDYVDYHSDRFRDSSLMVSLQDRLVALLPCNRTEQTLVSHGGLTYGGFLSDHEMTASLMLQIFEALPAFGLEHGIGRLLYKPMPTIYHQQCAEEDLYALFRVGAHLYRVDLATTIDLRRRLPLSKGKKHSLSKARRAGLSVVESSDFEQFFEMLTEMLAERHDARPTHTSAEMRLLQSRFPEQIKLFTAQTPEGEMGAGVIVYDCGRVVHAQYMASNSTGRGAGGLDLVVHHLLENYSDRTYFNFGISTTDQGRHLNVGLSRQKEMLGGRSTTASFYEWNWT